LFELLQEVYKSTMKHGSYGLK